MTASLRVGAVVLHFHAEAELDETLTRLLAQDHAPAVVVVADNGSNAEALATVLAKHPRASLLAMPDNLGYAAAMNRAVATLRDSDLDAYLLLTHDCRLEAAALTELATALASDSRPGAAGPVLRRRSGSVWSSGGTLTWATWWPSHRLSSGSGAPAACRWLDGAALLVSRDAFSAVNGFDEGYFLYLEDVDFGVRLSHAGYSVRCVTSARGSQEPGAVTTYAATRNHLRFVRLNAGRLRLTTACLRHACYLIADIVGALSIRRRSRVGIRWRAIRHAFTDQLDLDLLLAGRRPEDRPAS